jgi:hypothetical protein
MKKFIIAVIAVVLGFSSCSKESQLLGSWELETIQMQGLTLNAKDAKLDIVLTFKDGGVVDMSQSGYTESASYTINGNKIIIEGEEIEFELKGKQLILKGKFEIGDSSGNQVIATFKRR